MASSLKLCWIWPGPSKQNVKGDILTMKHRLSAYLPFIGLEPVGGYTTEVSIMHGQYTTLPATKYQHLMTSAELHCLMMGHKGVILAQSHYSAVLQPKRWILLQ